MDRRDLLRLLSASGALAFLPADLLATGRALHRTAAAGMLAALRADEAALIAAIGDIILPRTDTPGASDVNATGFIDRLLADWYPDAERIRFLTGLGDINARAVRQHGRPFLDLGEADRTALCTALDAVQGELDTAPGAFNRIKDLTIYGYFTSERVRNEVTHAVVIPGRFDGCLALPPP